MDKIKIIIFGGQNELSKNMVGIEINDDIFVIEAGIKIPDKTKPGVDYAICRIDYLVEHKEKIRGYFLTHGHDSITGGLIFYYDKAPAPVYCTLATQIMFKGFCDHNHVDFKQFDIRNIGTNDDINIAGRKISFFGLCCNSPQAVGIAINTDQGNIIFISNFVINHLQRKGFINETGKITQVCTQSTLLLMLDSMSCCNPGYCSPKFDLFSKIEHEISEMKGRVFFALDAPDLYNAVNCLQQALKNGRKIVLYNKFSEESFRNLTQSGLLQAPPNSVVSMNDINQYRPQDLLIYITGFGNALNHTISLLATRNNDNKIIFLDENDTFIYAAHTLPSTELSRIETLDELYHNDCKIISFSESDFPRMHAFEEDVRAMLIIFKPKYFVPISGQFKDLLHNAQTAIDMGIGLNHNNVMILDNGDAIEIENYIAKIHPSAVITGDVFVDGKGVNDIEEEVILERQKLSDEGTIILGASISKSSRTIVGGPDVQARGVVFLKDSESLMKEIVKLLVLTINNELSKPVYSVSSIEIAVKDIISKAVYRAIGKGPLIIPAIIEVE